MTPRERDRYRINPSRTQPRTASERRARVMLSKTYTRLRIELRKPKGEMK